MSSAVASSSQQLDSSENQSCEVNNNDDDNSMTNFPSLFLLLPMANVDLDRDVHRAIHDGDASRLRQLISDGFSVEGTCVSDNGKKVLALHDAIRRRRVECVEVLLNEANFDVNRSMFRDTNGENTGKSPLHVAASLAPDDTALLFTRMLLEHGADIHNVTAIDVTPLHVACKQGSTELLELLLDEQTIYTRATESPVNISFAQHSLLNDRFGAVRSPLPHHRCAASQPGNVDGLRLLFDYERRHHLRLNDDDLHSLMRETLLNGTRETVNLIVEYYLDVIVKCALLDFEILYSLLRKGYVDVALRLLEHNVPLLITKKCTGLVRCRPLCGAMHLESVDDLRHVLRFVHPDDVKRYNCNSLKERDKYDRDADSNPIRLAIALGKPDFLSELFRCGFTFESVRPLPMTYYYETQARALDAGVPTDEAGEIGYDRWHHQHRLLLLEEFRDLQVAFYDHAKVLGHAMLTVRKPDSLESIVSVLLRHGATSNCSEREIANETERKHWRARAKKVRDNEMPPLVCMALRCPIPESAEIRNVMNLLLKAGADSHFKSRGVLSCDVLAISALVGNVQALEFLLDKLCVDPERVLLDIESYLNGNAFRRTSSSFTRLLIRKRIALSVAVLLRIARNGVNDRMKSLCTEIDRLCDEQPHMRDVRAEDVQQFEVEFAKSTALWQSIRESVTLRRVPTLRSACVPVISFSLFATRVHTGDGPATGVSYESKVRRLPIPRQFKLQLLFDPTNELPDLKTKSRNRNKK